MLLYLVFLVQLARLRTTRHSFYSGLAVGVLCVAPQLDCFWRIFGPAAIPLWTILAFWIGLFVAIAHATLARFGPARAVCLVPFIWTGLEYFRSELYYLKLSWLNVGYAFSDCLSFPFHTLGVYGAGFVAALMAAAFVMTRFSTVRLAVVGIALFASFAGTRHHGIETAPAQIRIAGIQMEVPAERHIGTALDRLAAAYPNADLLVLSEYSLDGPVPDALKQWCRLHRKYLVAGGKDPAPAGDYYNTAFVVNPSGQIVFRQAKSVPVQFFKDGIPAPSQAVWNSPWGKIGICICYDLSYTRVTDRLVSLGAQLLVIPTMDVSDWGLRQHQLHSLVAPVRAAEYGIPIFRLASSGISQAVRGDGTVAATAPFPGDESMLSATLELPARGTVPLDRGLAPLSVGVTAALLIALAVVRRGQRSKPATPSLPSTAMAEDSPGPAPDSPTRATAMSAPEELQIRIHGGAALPTLVYLPGLHGDWTLIGSFRKAIQDRVRFVEITYPRTLDWSLDDYAAAVEAALDQHGIREGWLLGESFGSQVLWSLVRRGHFRATGVMLAGGFVRHPIRWGVRLVERLCGRISLSLLTRIMFGYAKAARFRYRNAPETLATIDEFIARRTELDRQAAAHRLHLIAEADLRPAAQQASLPVYALSGWLDPVVPWIFVRSWLRRHCPSLRDYRVIWSADHNVLGTAPDLAADRVVRWIDGNP
jgi:apolipoprotein N-acyltransferase